MDIPILKNEIDTDPLVRGYTGMTDAEVVTDMNLTNRAAADVGITDVMDFLLMNNTYKTDDGDDTQARSLWQRMKEIDAMTTTPTVAVANPWSSTSLGNITEIQQIKTKQLVSYITLSAQGNLRIALADTNFQGYLAGAQGAGCMSTAQETALLGLADNLQSRGEELSIGRVREGHVQKARL